MTKTGGSDKSFVLGYFDSDSAIAKNVLRRFLLRRQVRPTSVLFYTLYNTYALWCFTYSDYFS